ncbi:DUF2079 domain-containing protein [Gaiella sp.]|uniref:DUF2079 domain-containing protein n=1 Tax=Gaiella sp. TaxID=2663207 RepID=UPI002B6A9E6B|nr:DUF2079 domain-containing protein [Gaiella sp.]HWO80590.1 DUF2079 domain-containing protein [Gaiella sp.]
MTTPARVVAAATAAFGAGLSSLAVLQHRAFWTGRFDVGNLVQAVWSTAHGDVLSVTGLTGRQISRLGAHFDPIVAAFAPFWWLWPDPALLLVTQGLAVATGAVPVYLLGRRHLDSEWVAAGLALAYLLHPATQWLVLDDFHPVALATPLLLWGFWFLDSGRLLPFALVAGTACLTKEQIGLVVAAMGLWYAFRPQGRRVGLAIAVVGTAVSLVAVTVVVPHFAPGGGSPFEGRYESVGGSPGGIAKTAVTDPGAIVSEVTGGHDLAYLADLLLPLLGLPLLAPLAALTAAPELLLNLLSGTRTQTSIHFHYTAGALPGLFVAAILGAARLRRRFAWARWPDGRAVVLSTLLAGVLLGPLPIWRHVPFGSDLGTHEHVVGHHAAVARRALALVPPGAAVSASNTLGAHLSERRRIFSFPVLGEATWVAVDRQRPSYRDAMDAPVRFERALAVLRARGDFTVVFDEDGILVLRKRVREGSSAGAGTP